MLSTVKVSNLGVSFVRTGYFKYAIIQVVSTVFNNIHVLLLPFWYYELTGSKWASGSVFAVESLFSLIALPFAGVIIDRFPHRTLILITEGVRAIAVLGLLFVGRDSSIVLVLFIGAVTSVGSTMFFALQQAVIKVNVTTEHMPKAQALLSVVQGAALIAGPPLGAWMASVIGYKPVFAMNAASFVFSAVSVAFIQNAPLRHSSFKFVSDIRDALDLARSNRNLWLLYILQLLVYFCVGSLAILFIFFFKEKNFSLQSISIMMGAVGLGILVGSSFANRVAPKSLAGGALVASASGAILLLLASVPALSPMLAVPMMFLFGITSVSLGLFGRTSVQNNSPSDMIGRMSALLRLCILVGSSLSVWAVVGTNKVLSSTAQLQIFGTLLALASWIVFAAALKHAAKR